MSAPTGLNWARIDAEYEARRADEIARGIDVPAAPAETPGQAPTAASSGPSGRRRGTNGGVVGQPQYDYKSIAALWDGKRTIASIAQEVGCHRETVGRALDEAGIERTRRGGPPRSDTCAQGHSMGDALPAKNGGRACRTCHNRRKHETYRRKKARTDHELNRPHTDPEAQRLCPICPTSQSQSDAPSASEVSTRTAAA